MRAGAALPLAAINWENFAPGNIKKGFTTFRDRVYYGDVLPPVGSQTLSYARMLEMLSQRKVRPKRARAGPGCSTVLERTLLIALQLAGLAGCVHRFRGDCSTLRRRSSACTSWATARWRWWRCLWRATS